MLLAKAITLIESTARSHQAQAREVLREVLPQTGKSRRIGITGVPGVGKSTFIEAFGKQLTAEGHKVAVLAVDPSSARTGGSILGDKTRMAELSCDPNAYIRPSPAAGTLGGVNRMTRETMLLCEAAGFDVILVETVGVGQSETVVADMVDFFMVLMLPGAGDELQGIKKGVLEIADMIAVNKADGETGLTRARAAQREYRAALQIMTPASPNWRPPVLTCSGLTGDGLEEIWSEISRYHDICGGNGELAEKRTQQQVRWMHAMIDDRMRLEVLGQADTAAKLKDLEAKVAAGKMTPALAVEALFETIFPK